MLHKLTSLLLVLVILLAGSLQGKSILLENTALESRNVAKLKATASARKSPKGVPGWAKFWDDCDVFIRGALATKMCFVAGTQVVASHDGIETCLVPIEEIYPLAISNPDFRIWSKDEFSGEEGWKRPVTFFRTHPVELYHLQIDLDSDGCYDEVITGTGPHPFWIEREKKFVLLEELEAGDILTLSTSESAVVVSNIRKRAPPEQVFTTYNFEVEDFHTYFVGESQVWVHNTGKAPCQKVFSIYNRFRTGGKNGTPLFPWEAFEATVARLNGIPASTYGTAAGECMKELYKLAAKGQRGKVPSVTDIRKLMSGQNVRYVPRRLKGGGYVFDDTIALQLEAHHGVPSYVQKLLGISDDIHDSCTGLLTTMLEHRGDIDSVHAVLRKWIPEKSKLGAYTDAELISRLNSAYKDLGMDDFWTVNRRWLKYQGY